MLLFVTVAVVVIVVVIAAVVSFYSIINIVAVVYSVVLAALPPSLSLSFTGTNGKLVANSVFFILIVDRSERVPSTQVTQVRVKRVPLCYFYFIAFFN